MNARRTLPLVVALALLLPGLLAPRALAQADSPEELILRSRQAMDLTRAALSDVVEPVGGLLGRISPSSSFATANHGFGYGALSIGATGLRFEITDPDYTKLDAAGDPGTIEGPAGAVFADAEIGLFAGFGRHGRVKNVGAMDLLLRLGATIGDQADLADKVDVGSWGPILGAGMRLGLVRGENLPSVSISGGVNYFAERTFKVLGQVDDRDFLVSLDLKQTSSFLLLEVGKQWRGVLPFVGVGAIWHHLESSYLAEVVVDADTSTDIEDKVDVNSTQENLFGGLELGSGFFRFVLEAGSSSGNAYGTVYFKFLPFPGYQR